VFGNKFDVPYTPDTVFSEGHNKNAVFYLKVDSIENIQYVLNATCFFTSIAHNFVIHSTCSSGRNHESCIQLVGMASWNSRKRKYLDSFTNVNCLIPKSHYKLIMLHLPFSLMNVGHNTRILVKARENMTKHILCSQREDEVVSDILSEGLELLEASFKSVCK
jgi:hypothetical protein